MKRISYTRSSFTGRVSGSEFCQRPDPAALGSESASHGAAAGGVRKQQIVAVAAVSRRQLLGVEGVQYWVACGSLAISALVESRQGFDAATLSRFAS